MKTRFNVEYYSGNNEWDGYTWSVVEDVNGRFESMEEAEEAAKSQIKYEVWECRESGSLYVRPDCNPMGNVSYREDFLLEEFDTFDEAQGFIKNYQYEELEEDDEDDIIECIKEPNPSFNYKSKPSILIQKNKGKLISFIKQENYEEVLRILTQINLPAKVGVYYSNDDEAGFYSGQRKPADMIDYLDDNNIAVWNDEFMFIDFSSHYPKWLNEFLLRSNTLDSQFMEYHKNILTNILGSKRFNSILREKKQNEEE